MKLNPEKPAGQIRNPHDHPVSGPGADLQAPAVAVNDKGVVPGGGKWRADALKQACVVMKDGACFSMHRQWGAKRLSPQGLIETLHPQANAEDGDTAGKTTNGFN